MKRNLRFCFFLPLSPFSFTLIFFPFLPSFLPFFVPRCDSFLDEQREREMGGESRRFLSSMEERERNFYGERRRAHQRNSLSSCSLERTNRSYHFFKSMVTNRDYKSQTLPKLGRVFPRHSLTEKWRENGGEHASALRRNENAFQQIVSRL